MTPREVAHAFTADLRAGQGKEHRFWSDAVVSPEPMDGPMACCEGPAARGPLRGPRGRDGEGRMVDGEP